MRPPPIHIPILENGYVLRNEKQRLVGDMYIHWPRRLYVVSGNRVHFHLIYLTWELCIILLNLDVFLSLVVCDTLL